MRTGSCSRQALVRDGLPLHGSWWDRFVLSNKRLSQSRFRPRLYPVSHKQALDTWFQTSVMSGRFGSGVDELLEFGSGHTFRISKLLKPLFKVCSATDLEDVPVAFCPDGVTFARCTPRSLPYDTDRFDVVGIRSVVEHLPHPSETFQELSRVMKPGARLFMNLPNKWDYVSVIARLVGSRKSSILRHVVRSTWEDFPVFYRCNTKRALRAALRGSGLDIELFRPLPSDPYYLRFFVPFYLIGAFYQFAISVCGIDALQPSFVVILRKAGRPSSH